MIGPLDLQYNLPYNVTRELESLVMYRVGDKAVSPVVCYRPGRPHLSPGEQS